MNFGQFTNQSGGKAQTAVGRSILEQAISCEVPEGDGKCMSVPAHIESVPLETRSSAQVLAEPSQGGGNAAALPHGVCPIRIAWVESHLKACDELFQTGKLKS